MPLYKHSMHNAADNSTKSTYASFHQRHVGNTNLFLINFPGGQVDASNNKILGI